MPFRLPTWRGRGSHDIPSGDGQPLLGSGGIREALEATGHSEPTQSASQQVEDVTKDFRLAVEGIVTAAKDATKDKLFSLVSAVDRSKPDPVIYQLVDLVLAGGGMLGIAQVGFIYILEQCGLRFRSLGGASAGAITALLIAAKRKNVLTASSEEVLKLLATAPFASFLDVDPKIQERDTQKVKGKKIAKSIERKQRADALFKAVRSRLPKKSSSESTPAAQKAFHYGAAKAAGLGFLTWWHRRALEELCNSRGLYDGEAFTRWLRNKLDVQDEKYSLKKLEKATSLEDVVLIPTIAGRIGYMSVALLHLYLHFTPQQGQLERVVEQKAFQFLYSRVKANSKIALVAADITRQRMAVFPQDCEEWGAEADRHPANFARASMSIPVVYKPFTVEVIGGRNQGGRNQENVRIDLVDGGTLSNFPLELFYDDGLPSMVTTIGVQMGEPEAITDTTSFGALLMATYDNSRCNLDRTFVNKHAGHPGVATIPTEGFGWLDFDMERPAQVELFKRGAKTALEFLRSFNWEKYYKALDTGVRELDVYEDNTYDMMAEYQKLSHECGFAYFETTKEGGQRNWTLKIQEPRT